MSIPSASCTDYSYICVQISVVDGADYTDSDSTNNYHCVTFGDVSDGYAGIYQCAGELFGVSVEISFDDKNLKKNLNLFRDRRETLLRCEMDH